MIILETQQKCTHAYVYQGVLKTVYSSIVPKYPRMETTQMSTSNSVEIKMEHSLAVAYCATRRMSKLALGSNVDEFHKQNVQ